MDSGELMIHLAIWPNVAWIAFVAFGMFMIKLPEWAEARVAWKIEMEQAKLDALKTSTQGQHRIETGKTETAQQEETPTSSPSNDR